MFPSEAYHEALEKEFVLAYLGVGPIPAWQSALVSERNWHYDKLIEVKREEKRRNEEEAAKIRASSSSRRR